MRVLITGGAGFLGSHLATELESSHDVVIVDKKLGEDHDLLTIGCVESWLDQTEPDICIHLAARVGRLFGEDVLTDTVLDNAGMTALVARACGERGVRLAYASTSEVYGDQKTLTCYEDISAWIEAGKLPLATWVDKKLPHNAYGLSKRHGEEYCRMYAPNGLTIFRFSMPYGPGLPAGRGRAAIVNMLHQALHRQPMPVHIGAERSWCWIGDTVRAVRIVIEETDGGVFNVGRDDNAVPMKKVAKLACKLTGAPEKLIQMMEAPKNQTVVKRLSTRRLHDLGWKPDVSLEEGMGNTLEWVKSLALDGSVKQEVTVEAKEK